MIKWSLILSWTTKQPPPTIADPLLAINIYLTENSKIAWISIFDTLLVFPFHGIDWYDERQPKKHKQEFMIPTL